MATTIITKNGSGAPVAGDLVQGELAVDLTNKTLYSKDSSGNVFKVGDTGGGSPGTFTDLVATDSFTSPGIDDNATSTAITIDANENVGVGTANPLNQLVVEGPTTKGALEISTSVAGDLSTLAYHRGDAAWLTQTFRATDFIFKADSAGATERMRISSAGYVGIGTVSPGAHLDISNATEATLRLNHTGSNAWDISNNSNLKFSRGGTERMRLDAAGNLLVGKTVGGLGITGAQLTAAGQLFASADNTVPAYFNRRASTGTVNICVFQIADSAAGSIQATSGGTPAFAAPSDERLKDNITDHESELANVMALRPTRWDWKDEALGTGEGFIAQELEQTAWSDLVSEGDDGFKQVSGLGAVETRLIKAIQEQQAIIDELKAEVAALKGE